MSAVTVHKGDILTAKTEAVVNPANSFLHHGGGLAAILEARAVKRDISAQDGQERMQSRVNILNWRRDHANAPLLATGNAHVTSAGNLPFKHVIHAVGPIWNGGGFYELDLLELTMETIGARAIETGMKSIAAPAVSCGIFGFPLDAAARILVQVARWIADDGVSVEFWLFGDAEHEAFAKQVEDPLFGGV
jgi:O-acetyl-ADP-ribose deacetylase